MKELLGFINKNILWFCLGAFIAGFITGAVVFSIPKNPPTPVRNVYTNEALLEELHVSNMTLWSNLTEEYPWLIK